VNYSHKIWEELGRGGFRICKWGAEYGERVEREPITGLGADRQRGPGASRLVRVRGFAL
jgi:hypothetical protein